MNRWGEPEGYAERPHRVRYRVRDPHTGAVVERMTSVSTDHAVRGGRWFHALADQDLHLAKAARAILQQACSYFLATWTPIDGVPDIVVTDDEVKARIRRMDLGENSREAERVSLKRYPLQQLPWDQQRALVEQIAKLYRDWQFEWIGEATDEEERAYQGWRSAPAAEPPEALGDYYGYYEG